jgi:tetratricopeptide (TPR) repeat protein
MLRWTTARGQVVLRRSAAGNERLGVGRSVTFTWAASLLSLGMVASPARASYLPPPSEMMTPAEQGLLTDALRTEVISKKTDTKATLEVLDRLLAKDIQPTKFRGLIQMLRSTALLSSDRDDDALAAADEAVQLLPGYSGPLLAAASAYAYSNRAGEGADFLLRASQIDPDVVRARLNDYEVFNFMHRLDASRDARRIQLMSDRLLAIGWHGEKLDSRSNLAVAAIRGHLKNGDVAGARALIPEVLIPSQTYMMLASKRFTPIWPDLEEWTGPKLSRLWPVYLDEARSRWTASRNDLNAAPYIDALMSARLYSNIADEFYPAFEKLDPVGDYDLIFSVERVARALGYLGRWNDVKALYASVERVWPLGEDANALNVTANESQMLLSMGEPKQALALMDRTIAEAGRHGDVNTDAIVQMHGVRVCALYALGRGSEAAISLATAEATTDAEVAVNLRLCIGEPAAARRILLQALADDNQRDQVIALLQRRSHPPLKSAYENKLEGQWDALRADPQILAALAPYGRILPFAVNEAAQFGPSREPQAAGQAVASSD